MTDFLFLTDIYNVLLIIKIKARLPIMFLE